ncbi:MAG: SPFH/Band 7/PHB domain protein [Anaerofustis stercorihominis]|nr:SPFH/Band 7/PHB domain protein [Anaerofustis stercorihominis]
MVFVLLFIALVAFLATHIRIVPQANTFVIERLGVFREIWEPGVHFLVPFIDRVARRISMKERIADYPPQPVITKDNVTMQIDTVIYFMVTDPHLFSYGHDNPMMAMEKLTATTLRNIIGDLELDQTLTSRDHINNQMRLIIDEISDAWGIKVVRVEVKNILPPADIQSAMEKQMKAEREKRENVLRAEGERQAAILRAEGEKEAAILKADAVKEKKIREAQGEAEAIRAVAEATAKGLQMIKEAEPNQYVVAIKGLEALQTMADGQATKIIIPSELQSLAGLASSLTGVLEPDKNK